MERPTREFALQLISSKEKIESEVLALLDVLKLNNVDMNQPLVDNQGFPRSDIDVYQVRYTRHKIICMQNDLKNLTNQIESVLHELHAQQREGLGLERNPASFPKEFEEQAIPFAKIGVVSEGSPANKAGLQTDDLVLGFGTLRSNNFTSLQDVALIVQHSREREIPMFIRRSERLMPITLVPKTWNGKGLLGCVLLPYDSVDR